MKIIGLTGGIGSGKSTVAQFLVKLGVVVVDVDKIGHEILRPDSEAGQKVVATFGRQILSPSGEIDRSKLGEIVFNNPEALSRLNRIVHPRMHDMIRDEINEYRKQGVAVVIVEAAILIEANWQSLVDEIWVTIAPENAVIERLKDQRGLEEEQTLARIRSQLSNDERSQHANVIIDNNGNLDEVRIRVQELWQRLTEA